MCKTSLPFLNTTFEKGYHFCEKKVGQFEYPMFSLKIVKKFDLISLFSRKIFFPLKEFYIMNQLEEQFLCTVLYF